MRDSDDPYLVWCGSDPPPTGSQSRYKKVITLDAYPGEGNVYLQVENISRKLLRDIPALAMDMLCVGAYVYCADQAISKGGKALRSHGKGWYRDIRLDIPVANPELWNSDLVLAKLSETLNFLTDDYWEFSFRPLSRIIPQESYFPFSEEEPWFEADQVLMFSGGLDSLSGTLQEMLTEGKKVALVSHRPVAKISSRQRGLIEAISGIPECANRFLHIPVWLNKESGLTSDATQRARSFMYAMLGAVVADMHNLESLRFYENGIVSVNLPVSEQFVGATSSRSTHPKSLKCLSGLFTALLEKDFVVENPFLWKTKSEIVELIKEADKSHLVRHSNSCAHTRTCTKINTHCGVCSQCIERRLATLYNGLEDSDPEEMYKIRLFEDGLDRPDERLLVETYIRHAISLENIPDYEFFQRFPMISRAVTATGLPASVAGEKLFDLHRRHGEQVCAVIEHQIQKRAREIARGELRPYSLLRMLVSDSGKRTQKGDTLCRFPTPEGATWEDVSIDLTSDISLKITVFDFTKKYTAFEMGFADRRKVDMPNKQWSLLVALAECDGTMNWGSRATVESAQKRFQELRRSLREFLRLDGSPISNYTRKDGYKTAFHIADRRGQI